MGSTLMLKLRVRIFEMLAPEGLLRMHTKGFDS